MKKLLFVLLICLAVPAAAQKVIKNEELATFRMGGVKLYMTDSVTYALRFRTDNPITNTFPCILGDREQAVRLLTFIRDVKLGDNDVIDLENATGNFVSRGLWGSFRIHSEGKQFSFDITKKEIKKMIEAIEESR